VRVLLHMCCAPCTIVPLRVLSSEDCRVSGLFFNPNIHPYQEFLRRLGAVEQFARLVDLKMIYREEYDVTSFLQQVAFRESQRCHFCYHLRLEATARLAKKSGMDAFTSTLLYSKRQKHDLIRQIGEETGRRHGVPFLYRDFRPGWREGIEESKALGLYRQAYCGCIYSEQERYLSGKTKGKTTAEQGHTPPTSSQ
jgi:predicted adenine nucleotide alpha hydrolase (AANH) superfamily ATPase